MRIDDWQRYLFVGNQRAEFEDFFQSSWEPCVRAVVAVVGSPHLAEDQVAEAFARAWASWRRVRSHPAPRAWVVRTALNAGTSLWRRRGRDVPLVDHDLSDPGDLDDGLDATLLTAIWRLGIEAGTVRMHLSRGVTALRRELTPTSQMETER
jgi:RNA polymerase sigma-70 factor (ECF subfamily)